MAWEKIYEDVLMQNIAYVKHELQEEGIIVKVVNNINTLYPSLGEIQIFVQSEDIIKAKLIISKLTL